MAGSSIKTRIVPAAAIFALDVTNTGNAVMLLVTKKVHQNLPFNKLSDQITAKPYQFYIDAFLTDFFFGFPLTDLCC